MSLPPGKLQACSQDVPMGQLAHAKSCCMLDGGNGCGTGGVPEEGLLCTLAEESYHFGLAALINSLVRNGFYGTVAVGYRGTLPPWRNQLKADGVNGRYEVAAGVRVEFVHLDSPVHFTNIKPEFMQQLLRGRSGCKYIWYFDPDITVRCPWSFFVRWVRNGIALCEDVNGILPANHPLRYRWMEIASQRGLTNPQPLSRYYNGGFIGLPASCSGFLDLWQDVTRIAESEGLNLGAFGRGDRTEPFYKADQDVLNIAAMYSQYPLTTIGPDGMGFVPGAAAMYHAIGVPKPWEKKMVLSAILGVPPSAADKGFLENATHPIRLYGNFRLAARQFSCSAGALIGRFYRRR